MSGRKNRYRSSLFKGRVSYVQRIKNGEEKFFYFSVAIYTNYHTITQHELFSRTIRLIILNGGRLLISDVCISQDTSCTRDLFKIF